MRGPFIFSAVSAFLLAACGTSVDLRNPPEPDDGRGINITRLLAGESGAPIGVGVNGVIWNTALETLSFLPLTAIDPFTGVFTTDWGSFDNGAEERFRATVFVTSDELTASSLNVALFRQEFVGGRWVDAAVDPETVRQVEDAILLRAREKRIAEEAAS